MLVGEAQAQHWMKTANWENPERSLELQPGDQPANLLYNQASAISRWLHLAIPEAFPKACWVEQNLGLHRKHLMNLLYDSYNRLQIIFNENSGLLSYVDSIQVVFNSMLIHGLKWDLSFLVKRTRMEWETVPNPDLVTLANQLNCPLDESAKRKTTKILN